MNWEDLRLFDAAAASGSLSAGAKTLGLSQPQMSRRLRNLEQKIGARLFDRTPQGLRPTKAGAKLIPLAEKMRLAAEAVARAQPDLASSRLGVVRISVDEIREYFLTTRLSDLQSQLHDVDIEIFSGHEHLSHESRMTDIQVRSCLPDSETLIARRLGRTRYGLYAAASFRRRGTKTKREDLPWIGVSPDHLWYPLQKNWLEEFFDHPPAFRANTMTGMLNAARSGVGIALLPSFMAGDYKDLREIPCEKESLLTVEYLITHRDLLRETAVRRTVDALTALYKKNAALLSGAA